MRKWDTARARDLYEEGRSDKEIARLLDVTQNALRGWRVENNLPTHPREARVDDTMAEKLYRQGYSDHAIAKEFDVSTTTIRMWRVRNGFETNYPKHTAAVAVP